MDALTIFGIVVGIIGAAAGIVQVIQYFQERKARSSRKSQLSVPSIRQQSGESVLPTSTLPSLSNSEIIARFYFTREKVVARVHSKYEPLYSAGISTAFDELNRIKRDKGLDGYYAGQRFRPIALPTISDNSIELDVTPLNYAFVALMKDEETAPSTKRQIQEQISKVAKRLPKTLMSNDQRFNAHSYNLLGVLVCFITTDKLTLLRKRGRSVLTARYRWDISVGGHPAPEDLIDDQLDFARTVQRETRYEIGSISGDPRRIIFTGLHYNRAYGDVDLLALWPIENTGEQLRELITSKHIRKGDGTFETTKKARESYVWDTENLLVEFSGPAILQKILQQDIFLGDFSPESLICLELALLAEKQLSLGLGL